MFTIYLLITQFYIIVIMRKFTTLVNLLIQYKKYQTLKYMYNNQNGRISASQEKQSTQSKEIRENGNANRQQLETKFSTTKNIQITLSISFDEKINESPKIMKDFKVYLTNQGGVAIKYLYGITVPFNG